MRSRKPYPTPRRAPPPPVEPLEVRRLLSTTYYVSPTGLDTNPGTAALPLQTLAAVDALTLAAGDQVLLEGGATFAGTISLTAADAGTASAPITISSFGTGRATISAGGGDGIDVRDTAGVNISNLVLVGTSAAAVALAGSGIQLTNDLAGDVKLDHVYIDDVDVSGFGFVGIGIDGTTDGAGGGSGFKDVQVTNSAVHGNTDAGIFSYAGDYTANPAAYGLAHEAIYVDNVRAYDNTGRSGQTDAGNGIKLGNVDGATIEHSVAYGNGTLNSSTIGGPCGIWAYNCNAVVIQYNEAYDNAAAYTDGGGYDLDGGTTNSIIQYNYSHDNAGAGILLAQFPKATAWSGNLVRYNISQNDGRDNRYGGINFYTGPNAEPLADSQVYGNTVYLSAAAGTSPIGFYVLADTDSVAVYNNIFAVDPGLRPMLVTGDGAGLTLAGNDYWAGPDADLDLNWNGAAYATLDAFRAATGEEELGGVATGLGVDPGLVAMGDGGTLTGGQTRLASLPEYQLTATSPLVDAGVSLTALGINPGKTDFYGTAVPQGTAFDIGAAERIVGATGTSVAVSPAAVIATGTAVTLTATVVAGADSKAAPTGTVTFTLPDGTSLGSAALAGDGTAAATTAALPTGVVVVTATYSGDATHGSSTGTVSITSNAPGLASAVIRTTVPASVVAGTAVPGGKVFLSVTNQSGTAYSGQTTVELFATANGSLDDSSVSVTSAARSVTLRAGHVSNLTVPLTALPPALTPGDYVWVARITTKAGVASISAAGPSFTVVAAAVDLSVAVQSDKLPATATAGRRLGRAVTLAISNAGNAATSVPLTVTLYLSADGSLTGAPSVGQVTSKAIVRPGRKATRVPVTIRTIMTSIPAGPYTVIAVVTDAAGNTAKVSLVNVLTVVG